MNFTIAHSTEYHFGGPVFLEPHTLMLIPRNDPSQATLSFELHIDPIPVMETRLLDLEGNSAVLVWFKGLTDHLSIRTHLTVQTFRDNPFNFLTLPIDLSFPFMYVDPIPSVYLQKQTLSDPVLIAMINDLTLQAENNVTKFLMLLCQALNQTITYKTREEGAPNPAEITFCSKSGSCRDYAVLFIEICRQKGLCARFVSGYIFTNTEENPDLHAWAEVYIPGGGWRSFDPTHGKAVDSNYVTLAASHSPFNVAPAQGTFRGSNVLTTFKTHIEIASR